jgi:molybdenum cofactor cytidylyltransferase
MSPERRGSIAGIIPAAGSSRRMGRNKLLLDIDGVPVIVRAARRAFDAGLDPVIVVLGHDADAVQDTLEGLSCWTVVNPEHESGMNSSVRAGIAAVPDHAIAAMVILPDMPMVTSQMLRELIDAYRQSDASVVVSRYGSVEAPPMLHDRLVFPEFDEPGVEGCGKRIARRHRDAVRVVDWPSTALADLDAPEDYERLVTETVDR